ncbi:MAG: tRNA (uracil-5-)-methyltransferase [Halioglobus sp.]|jgi:tRNA (uracil-5-)-methyltransferase
MPLSAVDPANYQALLDEKVATVSAILTPFDMPEPGVFPSATTGYRLRAEFRMWHEGEALDYVMYRRDDPKTPVPINEFPIAHLAIQGLMLPLRECLKQSDELRRKLFQVEFLATLSGDMVVTLAYHRKLDTPWEAAAEDLITALAAQCPKLSVVGRSRKQKVVMGKDYVQESLTIEGRPFSYQQVEQSFTQPNGQINTQMIEWACAQAAHCTGDLLELYCGNGNFTLPLSCHFDKVIATELSKTAVRAARNNLLENTIENVHILRMSAEEVSQAIRGDRVFRRVAELPQPLSDYSLSTVFVDPPRAGLDDYTVNMVSDFDNILYVSCNPETLADNLQTLRKTHRVTQFALFDQFPYTHHMECGLLLQRDASHA